VVSRLAEWYAKETIPVSATGANKTILVQPPSLRLGSYFKAKPVYIICRESQFVDGETGMVNHFRARWDERAA
jgi:hypothetical protein